MPVQGFPLVAFSAVLLVIAGCSRPPESQQRSGSDEKTPTTSGSGGDKGTSTAAVASVGKDETKTYTNSDGTKTFIAPFEPPKLSELENKVEWVDQPVQDGMKLLEAYLKTQAEPIPVAQALELRNTNPQSNQQILSSLGRLPNDAQPANFEATIDRHFRGDVKSTNPILASAVEESDVLSLIGNGLFAFDWKLQPFAASESVVSWQSSKDGLYDKVVLRDDMTWSDGKPFTAHDIAFSFRTIMNPAVPVTAQRSGTDELKWVEAYDDHTVVFFHKRALATNKWNINFSILPKHIYESSIKDDATLRESPRHVELENQPVTAGSYTIAERRRGQEIVLKRREGYYMHNGKQVRDKPFFETVRFRIIADSNTALLALKSAQIDELEFNAEQWVNQTNDADFYEENTKVTGPEWLYFYFGWNMKHPIFSDRRVREAMSYAFDHEEMLKKLNYGLFEPANGMFHKDSWMAPKNAKPPYKRDLDRAEQLLKEAGWNDFDDDGVLIKTVDGKKTRFAFTIFCTDVPDRVKICALLKSNLDQLGIRCDVKPLERVTLTERMEKRDYEAVFGGWGTGTDPDTAENLWTTPAINPLNGRNYANYSNSYVDGLFQLGKQIESATEARQQIVDQYKLADVDIKPTATRAEVYGKIHELVYADQPYTFLFFRASFYGFNKQLRGYKFSPRGPYHYSPGFGSIYKAL